METESPKTESAIAIAARIEHIFISPGHNFFGHRLAPGDHPLLATGQVSCLAGRGLEGDRFLGYKPDYSGQITFFSMDVYDELSRTLHIFGKSPGLLRRNVYVRGVDLNALIDQPFILQGLTFSGSRECSPCPWMDQAFGPGAEAFLKNRGGLRARIVTPGILRVDEGK